MNLQITARAVGRETEKAFRLLPVDEEGADAEKGADASSGTYRA